MGQSSPIPFFAGGFVSFLLYSLAWTIQRDLKWRLRHWSGKEVVAALRAEYGTPPQADLAAVADMIALLADPGASVVLTDATDVYGQMVGAMRALIAGQPHQVQNQVASVAAVLASGIGTRASWDDELMFVFAAMADIQTGVLEENRVRRLKGLTFAYHPLVSLCAAWVLAHHHLTVDEPLRAQALFAELAKAAPGLPTLHRPLGRPPAEVATANQS